MSTHMIATSPCGCMSAVALTHYMDAKEQARFYREQVEDGDRVEVIDPEEYRRRGGVVATCPHEPKWCGFVSPYGDCPRCHKRVLKKKNGSLRAHKERFDWTCSQEPRP